MSAQLKFHILRPSQWLKASYADSVLGAAIRYPSDPTRSYTTSENADLPRFLEESTITNLGLIAEQSKNKSIELHISGLGTLKLSDSSLGPAVNLDGKVIRVRRIGQVDRYWQNAIQDSKFREVVTEWIYEAEKDVEWTWKRPASVCLVTGILLCQDVEVGADRHVSNQYALDGFSRNVIHSTHVSPAKNDIYICAVQLRLIRMKRKAKGIRDLLIVNEHRSHQHVELVLKSKDVHVDEIEPETIASHEKIEWKALFEDTASESHFSDSGIFMDSRTATPDIIQSLVALPDTWSAYPMLIQKCPLDLRIHLEEAACAHHCGRYQDAIAIYEEHLPGPAENILVCLQQADMLSSQGLEGIRQRVLLHGLSGIEPRNDESQVLLLEFMLADTKLWLTGEIKELTTVVRRVKAHLNTMGVEIISDVEFRMITLYYSVVDALRGVCNYLDSSYDTIFSLSEGNRFYELETIVQSLKRRDLWRLISTVYLLQLQICPSGLALRDLAIDGSKIAAALDSLKDPPLRFRSVLMRKALSEQLEFIMPAWSIKEKESYVATLESIKDKGPALKFRSWQEFSPNIAFDQQKSAIGNMVGSSDSQLYARQIDSILKLVELAQERNDNTKTNQVLIKARNIAFAWYKAVQKTDSSYVARNRLQEVQMKALSFHKNMTSMVFFYGATLCDYLTTLIVDDHQYDKALEYVKEFEKAYPDYDIPSFQVVLYSSATCAARTRGDRGSVRYYEMLVNHWTQRCHYWNPYKGLGIEDFRARGLLPITLSKNSNSALEQGAAALWSMMQWASSDVGMGSTSISQCVEQFGPMLADVIGLRSDMSIDTFRSHLEYQYPMEVLESIIGTETEPREISEFMIIYNHLLGWILDFGHGWASDSTWTNNGRSQEIALRLQALRLLLAARLHLVRLSLGKAVKHGQFEDGDYIGHQLEIKSWIELRQFESEFNKVTADSETVLLQSAIDMTLWRTDLSDEMANCISRAELEDRLADCNILANRFRNSNHGSLEYGILTQALRLHLQLFSRFQQPLQSALVLAERADELYTRLQYGAVDSNTTNPWIGCALSEEFSQKVHFDCALAVSYALYRNHIEYETGKHYKNEFLHWTMRSKDSAAVHQVLVESRVEKVSRQVRPQSMLTTQLAAQVGFLNDELMSISTAETSPNVREDNATRADETEWSSAIPGPSQQISTKPVSTRLQYVQRFLDNEDRTTIVDYINLSLGEYDTMLAILYRKGIEPEIIELGYFNSSIAAEWIRKNTPLHHEGSKAQKLMLAKHQDHRRTLREIGDLIFPLSKQIEPGNTVIICPTPSLHLIPLHALELDGSPFIERNPILYCRSLSMVTSSQSRADVASPLAPASTRALLLHPLHDDCVSTKGIQKLAHELGAELMHGTDLDAIEVIKAIENVDLFHYHGHIISNRFFYAEAEMVISKSRRLRSTKQGDAKLTAASQNIGRQGSLTPQDLLNVHLRPSALALVLGSGSAISTHPKADMQLSFADLLFRAGATSVISTLWCITDAEADRFSRSFYNAIKSQLRTTGPSKLVLKSPFRADGGQCIELPARPIDLARGLQTAMLELRNEDKTPRTDEGFNWAAFILEGSRYSRNSFLIQALGPTAYTVPTIGVDQKSDAQALNDEGNIKSILQTSGFEAKLNIRARVLLAIESLPSLEIYFKDAEKHSSALERIRSRTVSAIRAKQEFLDQVAADTELSQGVGLRAAVSFSWSLKIVEFLQESGYAQDRVSFLVRQSKDDRIARLVPVFCEDLRKLVQHTDHCGYLMHRYHGESIIQAVDTSMRQAYDDFLDIIHVQDQGRLDMTLPSLIDYTSALLDCILLLYVHGHTIDDSSESLLLPWFQQELRSLPSPSWFMAKMSCLSRMFGDETVIIIGKPMEHNKSDLTEPATLPRVSIAANISTFDDIWGPVSKVEVEGNIIQYNVRAGSIVRWASTEHQSSSPWALACHFLPYNLLQESSRVASRSRSSNNDQDKEKFNSLHTEQQGSVVVAPSNENLQEHVPGENGDNGGNRFEYLTPDSPQELIERATFALANPLDLEAILLVGTREHYTLLKHTPCSCDHSKFQTIGIQNGFLRDLETREEKGKVEIRNAGISVGFSGSALKADVGIVKKEHKFARDKILHQWQNYPQFCDLSHLHVFGAVMISRCNNNAIKCTILKLLETNSVRNLVKFLKDGGSYEDVSPRIWSRFLEGTIQDIVDLWNEGSTNRPHIKKLINDILHVLGFTGLDLDRKEYNAFWMPAEEPWFWRRVFEPSQHTWMETLLDGAQACAFAVLCEESFRFAFAKEPNLDSIEGLEMALPSCLETAIVVYPGHSPFKEASPTQQCPKGHRRVVVEQKTYHIEEKEFLFIQAPLYRLTLVTASREQHLICLWHDSLTREALKAMGKSESYGKGHQQPWKANELDNALTTHILSTNRQTSDAKTNFWSWETLSRLMYA